MASSAAAVSSTTVGSSDDDDFTSSIQVIGLFGGIGAGKSTVGKFLAQMGCKHIDADKIGHGCYLPGTKCFKALVAKFGDGIVAEDGTVNRKALGGIVFGNEAKRQELNELVWPYIKEGIQARVLETVTQPAAQRPHTIVVEAAVLVEAGWTDMFDEVWYVHVPRDIAWTRLVEGRGMPKEVAERRIVSQEKAWADKNPESYTTVSIDNSKGMAELAKTVREHLQKRHPGTTTDEVVMLVDENNKELGNVPRSRVRAENLWHRATYIFIKNSEDKLYVQKRSWVKDNNPGLYDPVAGGVVAAGESYELSAERELEEEMGIPAGAAPLKPLFTFPFTNATNKVWGAAFEVEWDKPVVPQFEEVDEVEIWSVQEIFAKHKSGVARCTADGMHALQLYSDYHKAQATRVAAAAVRRRRLVVAAAAFAAVTAVALWAKRR